jgi:DNA-binding MarR family transcriptional regulator
MWRAFYAMRRHLDKAIERQLADAGLSSADYDLLAPLSETPGGEWRGRDLGNHVGWDRSRLSHQLRRMEQRGLITRRDCPSDARGTMITLTPTGRKAVEAAAPGHVETVRRYFVDLLTPEEIDTLTAISIRIRDNTANAGRPTESQP